MLTIEWTNQHGCGGDEDRAPHKLNCNLVLQYMVQDTCDPSKYNITHISARQEDSESLKYFTLCSSFVLLSF